LSVNFGINSLREITVSDWPWNWLTNFRLSALLGKITIN